MTVSTYCISLGLKCWFPQAFHSFFSIYGEICTEAQSEKCAMTVRSGLPRTDTDMWTQELIPPPPALSWACLLGELYPDPWILQAHSDTEGSGIHVGPEDTGEHGPSAGEVRGLMHWLGGRAPTPSLSSASLFQTITAEIYRRTTKERKNILFFPLTVKNL